MIKEFRKFIARGNVVDMAVGIIIGAAFTGVVQSVVGDLINPFIFVLTGGMDFSDWFYVVGDRVAGDYPTVQAARDAGEAVFAIGTFVTKVINFLIVAWVVFLLVKGVHAVQDRFEKEEAAAPAAPKGPTEVELLTEIRDALRREP